MRRVFPAILVGLVIVALVSPVMAELPKPKLIEVGSAYQLKTPAKLGPRIPELPSPPGLIGIKGPNENVPTSIPTAPTTAPKHSYTINGLGPASPGGVGAVLSMPRDGSSARSVDQDARRSLKKLIRQLG